MERKGFTLVELLVVISIIALLMAILMPVLSKVKALANQMYCGTNLSGIGKSMMLYAGENDDDYPIAGGRKSNWTSNGHIEHFDGLDAEEAYGDISETDVTITSSLYLLVKYVDMTPAQFVCPGDVDTHEYEISPALIKARPEIEFADLWDFGGSPGMCCSYSYHSPYISTMSPQDQAFPITQASSPRSPLCADRNPYTDKNAKEYLISPDQENATTGEQGPSWKNGYYDPDKTGNAAAHQRNGQNVLFNDTHVSFERYPNVGINDDNIYQYWPDPEPDAEAMQVKGEPVNSSGLTLSTLAAPQSRRDALLVNEKNY